MVIDRIFDKIDENTFEFLYQKYRENVNNYMLLHTITPLYFWDTDNDNIVTELNNSSLDNLILDILDKSYFFPSIEKKNIRTCYPNKFRSSLDIWRHAISVEPEISIFEVMETLWKNGRKMVGQYCSDVRRRVFKLRNHVPEYFVMCWTGERDEFGMQFYEWGFINKTLEDLNE